MSTTSTFKPDDFVWIAEAIDYGKSFALRHGIVKEVKWSDFRVTVQWTDASNKIYMTTDHIANNLAVTADEAIQKFLDWAKSELLSQKRAYYDQAVERQAKTQASDPAPTVIIHKLDEVQLTRIIAAIKEKQ